MAAHRTYDLDEGWDVIGDDRRWRRVPGAARLHGPCMASPGHALWYLNVLAGPEAERSMAISDDPAHAWIRELMAGPGRSTPRVPMTTAEGRHELDRQTDGRARRSCASSPRSTPCATAPSGRSSRVCSASSGMATWRGLGQALMQERGAAALRPGPQRAGDGAHRLGLCQGDAPAADVGVHHPRSAPARPTWSPARRWRRSTGCRCCCCPATSSPPAGRARCSSSWSDQTRRSVSVNDALPAGLPRYWDRVSTAPSSCRRALLGSDARADRSRPRPARSASALPQDVQAEAWDFPDELFASAALADAAARRRTPIGWPRAADAAARGQAGR